MIERRDFLKFAASLLRRCARLPRPAFRRRYRHAVTRAFSHRDAAPNGLQATCEGLWVLDQATNRVALVHYDDGHVIRQFDTETDRGSGITFDGEASLDRVYLQPAAGSRGRTEWPHAEENAQSRIWPGEMGTAIRARGTHRRARFGMATRRIVGRGASGGSRVSARSRQRQRRAAPSLPPAFARTASAGTPTDRSGSPRASTVHFSKWTRRTARFSCSSCCPLRSRMRDGVVLQPHGMTVWNGEIWFSVAETGEVYRVAAAGLIDRHPNFHRSPARDSPTRNRE